MREQPNLGETYEVMAEARVTGTLEPSPDPSIALLQRHKHTTLLMLLALFFANAASDAVLTSYMSQDADVFKTYRLLLRVVYTVLFMHWYILDAQQHQYRMSKAMFLMLVGFSLLAAPFYFFATRGTGAWRACGRAFLFLWLGLVAAGLGGGPGYFCASLLHR